MSNLSDILTNSSLTVDEKVEKTTKLLNSLPDRGVSEVIKFILNTDDPAAATYPANYLALLPNLQTEKSQIVEHILNERQDLMIAAVNLIKDMPDTVINRLLDEYFKNPSAPDRRSLLFEIAIYFPERLHKFASQITDKRISEAILPGGLDSWVDNLVEQYHRTGDPLCLRKLSRFRTDKALEALIKLQPIVPDEDKQTLCMYIESSGVFPDTRKASVYFNTYRGFVVPRAESPHHMGRGFSCVVPKCPICDTPATRILTLDAAQLDFEIESGQNPSFFWYQCPHPPSYIVVRFNQDGIEGIMTPLTDDPVDTDLIPGELSLLLEEDPNQFGRGRETSPGFSNHQVGGYPAWINLQTFPRCPDCGEGMRFLASLDSGMTPFGRLGFDGILYGFWCESCAVSCTYQQTDD